MRLPSTAFHAAPLTIVRPPDTTGDAHSTTSTHTHTQHRSHAARIAEGKGTGGSRTQGRRQREQTATGRWQEETEWEGRESEQVGGGTGEGRRQSPRRGWSAIDSSQSPVHSQSVVSQSPPYPSRPPPVLDCTVFTSAALSPPPSAHLPPPPSTLLPSCPSPTHCCPSLHTPSPAISHCAAALVAGHRVPPGQWVARIFQPLRAPLCPSLALPPFSAAGD